MTDHHSRSMTVVCGLTVAAAVLAVVIFASSASAAPLSGPRLGRSFVMEPERGVVLVALPGRRRATRLTRGLNLSFGSTIDARNGSFLLETARPTGGLQTADVNGGIVKVTQPGSGGGVTNVDLTAQRLACGEATAARVVKVKTAMSTPGHGHRRGRTAGTAADQAGLFRLIGSNQSAVNDGPAMWTGTDTCQGTQMADSKGEVTASLQNGVSNPLTPGSSWLSRCLVAPPGSAASGDVCVGVLSTRYADGNLYYGLAVDARTSATTYQLCQTRPASTADCQTWQFGPPNAAGNQIGAVACSPKVVGPYHFTWKLEGIPLGVGLDYQTRQTSADALPCTSSVGATFPPFGEDTELLPANAKIANPYALATPDQLLSMGIYTQPTGTAGVESVQGVVYQDLNGAPGPLLGSTDTVQLSQQQEAGTSTLVFASPLSLPPGEYWLGILTGGDTDVVAVRMQPGTTLAINADNLLDGPSNPFGPFNAVDGRVDLNALYVSDPSSADATAIAFPVAPAAPEVRETAAGRRLGDALRR